MSEKPREPWRLAGIYMMYAGSQNRCVVVTAEGFAVENAWKTENYKRIVTGGRCRPLVTALVLSPSLTSPVWSTQTRQLILSYADSHD